MLNERRRVPKVDSAIKDIRVSMGLASTLLTLRNSKIMQSQSSTDLRVDGFHALIVVSIL